MVAFGFLPPNFGKVTGTGLRLIFCLSVNAATAIIIHLHLKTTGLLKHCGHALMSWCRYV